MMLKILADRLHRMYLVRNQEVVQASMRHATCHVVTLDTPNLDGVGITFLVLDCSCVAAMTAKTSYATCRASIWQVKRYY